MADFSRPDLCIVGAGALGIALALHARQFDASVMLIERGRPEPGDQPSIHRKLSALAASANLAQSMRKAERLGLTRVEPKLVHKTIHERARAVATEGAVLESRDHLVAQGIDVQQGEVSVLDARTVVVGEAQVRPRHLVLALGGVPVVPPIPGLKGVDYFTTDSIADSGRKLTHLLVIGGGPDAVTLAQVYRRLGSAVTLVPQGALLEGFDRETVGILLDALSEEGIEIVLDGTVAEILPRTQGTGVIVEQASSERKSLDVSHVLVAMGRAADVEGLEIAKLRLRPGRSGSLASGALGQTGNRIVRAVGYAAGIDPWSEALVHGRAVVEALLLGAPRRPPGVQPKLVLTDPPLAQIGTPAIADRRQKPGSRIVRANVAETEAALALGVTRGMARVTVDPAGHILEAGLIGPAAGEIASMLALAQQKGLTLGDLNTLSLPQPSHASLIRALGENHGPVQPVSKWTRRRQALRRLLPR